MPSSSALPMSVFVQRRNQNKSTSPSFQNAPRHICLVVHLPSIDYDMDVVFGVQLNHFPHPAMEFAVAKNSQEITAPQRDMAMDDGTVGCTAHLLRCQSPNGVQAWSPLPPSSQVAEVVQLFIEAMGSRQPLQDAPFKLAAV